MGKKGTTVMPGVYKMLKGRKESSKLLSPLKQQKLGKGMLRMKNNMY
jgi:hypothetical protein